MYGSTYSTVKQAIITRLADVDGLDRVEILAAPPVNPLDVHGQYGTRQAIWIADAEGDYDNVVLCGAGRLDLEELYDLTVVFQALPLDTDDTQIVCDRRVDEMLGAFLKDMADDATFGVAATDDLPLVYITISRAGFRRFCGPFPDANQFPSRCELTLHVEARISFT